MFILRYVVFCLLVASYGAAQEKKPEAAKPAPVAKAKKPQVLELIRPANDLMSMAQEAYISDDSKKAIALFRDALAALMKLEQEYPDWASSSEFAPVRFRKAICETEIERILLEEAQASSRTIAVTDTRELEKMRAERKRAAATNKTVEVTYKLGSKLSGAPVEPSAVVADTPKPVEKTTEPDKPVNVRDELEWAKDMILVERFEEVDKALISVLKKDPENRDARFLMALSKVQQGRLSDGLIILEDLMEDSPRDESALLLAAGAHLGLGEYAKSMEFLDKVMKANPQRPDAYLNMAWLLLDMRPDSTSEAEMYYRQGVKLGLARNRDIERWLGIKQ